jgi:hypothetical protein
MFSPSVVLSSEAAVKLVRSLEGQTECPYSIMFATNVSSLIWQEITSVSLRQLQKKGSRFIRIIGACSQHGFSKKYDWIVN